MISHILYISICYKILEIYRSWLFNVFLHIVFYTACHLATKPSHTWLTRLWFQGVPVHFLPLLVGDPQSRRMGWRLLCNLVYSIYIYFIQFVIVIMCICLYKCMVYIYTYSTVSIYYRIYAYMCIYIYIHNVYTIRIQYTLYLSIYIYLFICRWFSNTNMCKMC